MSLYLSSLNSGSNGNCYYIGNRHEAVLVDAGISCRETERRMIRLGLPIRNVKAIFITHEHTDHVRGAEVLSKKHGIPVYITQNTYSNSRLRLDPLHLRHFASGVPIQIGNLTVIPFPKWHDASEPHSFIVRGIDTTVGVFTDIGSACNHVSHHLGQCHAAFLEANYDEEMLERGRYPYHLKQRIRSAEGHLSNDQALELFNVHRAPFMKLLILSHLSAENNRPQLVHDLFSKHANGAKIVVASRFEESEVFWLGDVHAEAAGTQLSLFTV
jgi:phosphoribosyl 1,2-cyclic phosphodiesterase